MMKNLLTVFLFTIASISLLGQYIPNGGFEDWDTTWMFREPTLWNTGNMETYTGNYLPAVRTVESYSGNYALRLQSASYQGGTVFGYVFANGMLNQETELDTIQYFGGFPVTAAPDALHGYFYYHIATNDTALAFVSFKKSGKVIGQKLFKITGTVNEFHKLDFDLFDMTETPDSAIIAFACTNAFVNPIPGNWMIIDSLWFTGTTDTIPNCDFESWDELSFFDPHHWTSLNELIAFNMGEPAAFPTTDAHSGENAICLKSQLVYNQFAGIDTFTASILLSQYGDGSLFEYGQNFPLNINPSSLKGFYKFIPAGNDTAGIAVTMYDINSVRYNFYNILPAANEYTAFEVNFDYPANVVMQQIYITFTTNFKGQGNRGAIGSLLYLDDLDLVNPCEGQQEFSVQNTSANNCYPQTLDAGSGWDTYYWSTGAISQTIHVVADANYSITVTDNNTGCYAIDTIAINANDCNSINEEITNSNSYTIYPVPADDYLIIDVGNMKPGHYAMEITSITGSIVRKELLNIGEMKETRKLILDDLATGLYLLKITGKDFSQVEKLRIK